MSKIQKGDVVEDEFGNAFAVDKVHSHGHLDLHSVVTKQPYVRVDRSEVTKVDGARER